GLAQLERIEELVRKKRLIHSWYRQRLEELPGAQLNTELDWARNTYWMTSLVLSRELDIDRDQVVLALKRQGLDTPPFFPPISSFPMFTSCEFTNPTAYRLARRGLNLPSGHNLTESDIDRVCAALHGVLTGGRLAALAA